MPSEIMSRDARKIIEKMLEVDSRKRIRARDLLRESAWIQCKDLPLSVFENAGTIFRASSMDGYSSLKASNNALNLKQSMGGTSVV